MIYQDPLAYLLGLEGIALLDAWAGDHDRAFTEARLAEIRRLLADKQLRNRGVLVEQVSSAVAYEQVSAGYDADAGGGLFAADEPVVAEYLAGREPGVALGAACGTGRFAGFLARRGHRVIGVDSSPDMLARARQRVPAGGRPHLVIWHFQLPLADRLPTQARPRLDLSAGTAHPRSCTPSPAWTQTAPAPPTSPRSPAASGVLNRCTGYRDTAYREDSDTGYTGNVPQALATCR
ncbi:MAG: methyltransferase domain-containing protein [Streptosporangiaceae bacterium]|jgi:hypothetical protein